MSSSTTNTTHKSSGREWTPGEDTGKGNSHPLIHPAEDTDTQMHKTHTKTQHRVSLWGWTNRKKTCYTEETRRYSNTCKFAAAVPHTHASACRGHTGYTVKGTNCCTHFFKSALKEHEEMQIHNCFESSSITVYVLLTCHTDIVCRPQHTRTQKLSGRVLAVTWLINVRLQFLH